MSINFYKGTVMYAKRAYNCGKIIRGILSNIMNRKRFVKFKMENELLQTA